MPNTFPYEPTPGSGLVCPEAVLGPFRQIAINRDAGTVFVRFPIHASAEALAAGKAPVGTVEKIFAGDEAQQLKAQHAALFSALVAGAAPIGESLIPEPPAA